MIRGERAVSGYHPTLEIEPLKPHKIARVQVVSRDWALGPEHQCLAPST